MSAEERLRAKEHEAATQHETNRKLMDDLLAEQRRRLDGQLAKCKEELNESRQARSTCLLTHSLTYPLTHSPTHPLTHFLTITYLQYSHTYLLQLAPGAVEERRLATHVFAQAAAPPSLVVNPIEDIFYPLPLDRFAERVGSPPDPEAIPVPRLSTGTVML